MRLRGFVRHAYFLGANDPYSALKTTLKSEIDADAWATLNSDTSRPFEKPTAGRIAVKVINHWAHGHSEASGRQAPALGHECPGQRAGMAIIGRG